MRLLFFIYFSGTKKLFGENGVLYFYPGWRANGLHYGYYDKGIKNHPESLEKMNEVLAKRARIQRKDRVLDAGCGWGRLIIEEYFLRDAPPLSSEEKKAIQPWLEGWVMPSLLAPHELGNIATEIGFRNIQVFDLSAGTGRSILRLKKMSEIARPVAWLFKKLHIRKVNARNWEAVVSMMRAYDMGL